MHIHALLACCTSAARHFGIYDPLDSFLKGVNKRYSAAMDTFSSMIIGAVDQIKNAVVKIDIFKTINGKIRPAGSGSG